MGSGDDGEEHNMNIDDEESSIESEELNEVEKIDEFGEEDENDSDYEV